MRWTLTVFCSAVLFFGSCKGGEGLDDYSQIAAADGLPGNVRVALGKASNVTEGEHELLLSSEATADSVVVCDGTVAADQCIVGAAGYKSSTKVTTKDNVNIYKADGTVKPSADLSLIVVAKDAAGTVLESQKVGFQAKGQGQGQGDQTANTTGGTGGQKGAFDGTFDGGGRFKINVPQDNGPDKAHGLLVLLHGSGASSYDRFVQEMAQVSQQHGLIPVSVLAPNGQGWNEGGEEQAADYLDNLIQNKLYKEYNIDKRKIFFSGQSSGGGFLASHFIPLKGANYQGGAFLQCGMQPPRVQWTATEQMKQNFKLHFEITTGDGIWTQFYDQAIQAYQGQGLTVTSDNTKPGGHCAFDQAQIIQQYITGMLPQ